MGLQAQGCTAPLPPPLERARLWICSPSGAPEAGCKHWRLGRVLVGLGLGLSLLSPACSKPRPHPSSSFTPSPTSLGGDHDKIYSLIPVITGSVRATLQRDCRTRKRRMSECPPRDFPGGSEGKASAYSAGDPGSIPGSGRSSGEGNGIPLQYSCLESAMDGGACWGTVHGFTESPR